MPTFSFRRHQPGPAVAAALVLGVALLSGCGGSDGTEAATGSAPPASTAAATTAEPAAGDCASAQPEIEAGVNVTGFVTAVEVASCDSATVTTSLGTTEDDVQSALGICAIAANQAAGQGVAAVSIVSSTGTALATGTDSTDCAPAS